MTSLLVGLRSLSDVRRLSDAKQQAKRLREIASDAINELGRLARGLHSSVLDDLGIEVAIQRYADEFSHANDIRVTLTMSAAGLGEFSSDEHIHLYRIVQEALTNVARHSKANCVNIEFKTSEVGLDLIIRDDGQGFSTVSKSLSRHLGIEGMRQRAASLGGTLQTCSAQDGGAQVHVHVPKRLRLQGHRISDQVL
jgi:signal transduction histidine kinase